MEFGGRVLFLDRDNINTDEIIPARYLSEGTKEALRPYLMEDLSLPGFDPKRDIAGRGVIVTRSNFGCGSSREHAPWAMLVNGIKVVAAESFARIFRANMFNCGMLALELPRGTLDSLFRDFSREETNLLCSLSSMTLSFTSKTRSEKFSFSISPFHRALVEAGGWVEYAVANF